MKTFDTIFHIILVGDKEASRKAARSVRKLLYSSDTRDNDRYQIIQSIIDNAPITYAKIQDEWRQIHFVTAISVIYFLHNKQNEPDFLFPWLFQLLQHDNGNVRYAAVRMIEHELGLLTYHIRFPREALKQSRPNPTQADRIIFGLQTNLHSLAKNSWRPAYDACKYIDSLPSGTYKSVQLIFEALKECYNEAPKQLSSDDDVLEWRKHIEDKLIKLLKKTSGDFTLEHIRDIIYNENGHNAISEIISMFDDDQSSSEFNIILEIVNDAWNYFPHKSLGGLSPVEKMRNINK